MKMKTSLIALVSALLILPAGTVTANAATKRLTTMPKRLRGTWYHYYGKAIGLQKVIITKHHYTEYMMHHRTHIKHAVVESSKTRGKWHYYMVIDKKKPDQNYSGSDFAMLRMKLRGKKQWVLVQPQQDSHLKPNVLTHFYPGKHQYQIAISNYRYL